MIHTPLSRVQFAPCPAVLCPQRPRCDVKPRAGGRNFCPWGRAGSPDSGMLGSQQARVCTNWECSGNVGDSGRRGSCRQSARDWRANAGVHWRRSRAPTTGNGLTRRFPRAPRDREWFGVSSPALPSLPLGCVGACSDRALGGRIFRATSGQLRAGLPPTAFSSPTCLTPRGPSVPPGPWQTEEGPPDPYQDLWNRVTHVAWTSGGVRRDSLHLLSGQILPVWDTETWTVSVFTVKWWHDLIQRYFIRRQ